MKKLFALTVGILIGGLLAIALIPKSQPAPTFSLADLNGKTIDNQHL